MFNDVSLKEIGIYEYGFIKTDEIVFLEEVRGMCEVNRCRKYGTSWACPPAVGTVDECKEEVMRYDTGMVFSGKYNLRSPFDYRGMVAGGKDFKDVSDRLDDLLKEEELRDFLLLSNESCIRCEECTYPDNPCRFPEKLFPAVEGYGIMVTDIAKSVDVKYNNGDNTVTYFGLLLFNKSNL